MAPTAYYVAVARPDLQYTTSVLMRTLETPLKLQEMPMMRLASYINVVPELRWDFQNREMPKSTLKCTTTEHRTREHEGRSEVVLCSGASTCSTATVSSSTRYRLAAPRSCEWRGSKRASSHGTEDDCASGDRLECSRWSLRGSTQDECVI